MPTTYLKQRNRDRIQQVRNGYLETFKRYESKITHTLDLTSFLPSGRTISSVTSDDQGVTITNLASTTTTITFTLFGSGHTTFTITLDNSDEEEIRLNVRDVVDADGPSDYDRCW